MSIACTRAHTEMFPGLVSK